MLSPNPSHSAPASSISHLAPASLPSSTNPGSIPTPTHNIQHKRQSGHVTSGQSLTRQIKPSPTLKFWPATFISSFCGSLIIKRLPQSHIVFLNPYPDSINTQVPGHSSALMVRFPRSKPVLPHSDIRSRSVVPTNWVPQPPYRLLL